MTVNWQEGLRRLSLLWWGFWGGVCILVFAIAPFTEAENKGEIAGGSFLGAVAAYFAHRITCWILAGFAAPRS